MEAVAKHDFKARADDELSFSAADILNVLSPDLNEKWYKAEKLGREGWIPSDYVKMKPCGFLRNIYEADADALLLDHQPDGAFLVCPSESTPGDFSIRVKFDDHVKHYKVLRDGGGKYFLWIVKFGSINELLEYHRSSSVSRSETIYLKDYVE